MSQINSDIFGEQEAEEQDSGSRSITVWKRYFNAGANWFILLIFILFLFFSQFVISGSDYFVNFWVQQEELRLQNRSTYLLTIEYLYIYAGLIVGVLVVNIFLDKLCFRLLRFLGYIFRFALYDHFHFILYACDLLLICIIKCFRNCYRLR